MDLVLAIPVALATLALAEPAMAIVHRFVFHGPLWSSHRSHHEHPTARRLVFNDLLWIPPLALALGLVAAGLVSDRGGPIMVGLGAGIGGYVFAYVFAHDGVAHGRFWVPARVKRWPMFRAITRAHHAHHRGGPSGTGAAPFSVYLAVLEHRRAANAPP